MFSFVTSDFDVLQAELERMRLREHEMTAAWKKQAAETEQVFTASVCSPISPARLRSHHLQLLIRVHYLAQSKVEQKAIERIIPARSYSEA